MVSERRVADTSGDRRVQAAIMLASLIREAKEREKHESARDKRPTVCLETTRVQRVSLPNRVWDLVDMGVVAVRIGPASPSCDISLRTIDDEIRPQRDGPDYLGRRKGHQPEIPTTVETLRVSHYLVELTLAPVECANARDCNW